ncbi:MAG TPA: cell envelope integrity protein TolA, partial [Ramlibacter sp.]|nr:cell envelope integrity protein TolA [Ramlibacter sp.]
KKLEARKKREDLEREKKLEAKRKQEELRREQIAEEKAEKKAAEEKRRKEELAKASKSKQQEERVAQLRKENLARMMKGLEGGTGAPDAGGTAARSSGPSASYGGRVQARVRPNIVFTDDVAGNPAAEVEVRAGPDGTIRSRRIMKSSGVKSWDEAVLRALDKTEVLPPDVDGKVPPHLVIQFKPKS